MGAQLELAICGMYLLFPTLHHARVWVVGLDEREGGSMKISEYAESLGVHVSTWSPGDGVTRYRFHRKANEDYNSGNELKTVLGRKNAILWLDGFKCGREA